MAQDLRTFMAELKNNDNEYLQSADRISANLGIPSFLEKLQKSNRFPSVLFTNVTTSKGLKSKYPVLSNLFASRSRLAKTIGTTPKLFAESLVQRTQAVPVQLVAKREAPVKEVVLTGTEAGVGLLPIVTHHSGDAGGYITAASVWCRDVDTGEYNCAMLRV